MTNKRFVLISGARGGIGRTLVNELIDDGHAVVAADIEDIELETASNAKRLDIMLDVTSAQQCAAAVESAVRHFGKIDTLINVAGVCYGGTPSSIEEYHWQRTFDVNVRGVFLLTQAALPILSNCSRADIINVSSIWGVQGNPNLLAYSASKFAVEGYTAGLREYGLPNNIRVGSIQVDKVDTGFRRYLGEQGSFPPEMLRRMLTPADVSAAIRFMLSVANTAQVSSLRLDAPLWTQKT